MNLLDIIIYSYPIVLLSMSAILAGISIRLFLHYKYMRKKYDSLYVLYAKLEAMDKK